MTAIEPDLTTLPFPPSLEALIEEELAGEFRIGAPLPDGPFGRRFRAEDLARSEVMDLTFLEPLGDGEEGAAARFLEALKGASLLDHPHLNPISAYGVSGPLRWYAVPASSDRTLREELDAVGPLPLATVKRIGQQIASALDQAHRRGMIHGALTTDEVMLAPDGWVRVQGIGIAGAIGRELPDFSRLVTPAQGPDQPALAAILRECLTGEVDAPLPSALAATLAPVIQRATRERPSERFRDLLDLVGALDGSAPIGRPLQPTLSIADRARSDGWKELLAEEFTERPAPRRSHTSRLATLLVALATIGGAFAIAPWFGEDPGAPSPSMTEVAPPPTTPIVENATPAFTAPPPAATERATAPTPAPAPAPARHSAPPQRVVRTPPPRRVVVESHPPAPQPAPPTTVVVPAPAPVPPAPGTLFVNATPWGEVLIDGHPMGNTPLIGITITPGSHRIQVRRDGFVPYFATIDVAPGGTARLTDITLRELGP